MIINIEEKLYYIRQYLESTGKYEIYNRGEYSGPIHAYIYKEEDLEAEFEVMQNRLINLAHHEHIDIKHGVLMINANNKTPREIDDILSERLYQNIF